MSTSDPAGIRTRQQKIEKIAMRKVSAALTEAQKACEDLVEAISVVKEKKRQVDVVEVKRFVGESRKLQALLEDAVNDEEDEEDEEVEEVEESRPKKKSGSKASSAAVKAVVIPQGEKRLPRELIEDEPEKPKNKREREDVDSNEDADGDESSGLDDSGLAVVLPPVKKASKQKGKLRNGCVARGPDDELVFYTNKQGNTVVECPVFGKDRVEVFGKCY